MCEEGSGEASESDVAGLAERPCDEARRGRFDESVSVGKRDGGGRAGRSTESEGLGPEDAVRTPCDNVPRRDVSGVEDKREGGGGEGTSIERLLSLADLP